MKILFPVVRTSDVSAFLAPFVKNMVKVFKADLHVFHVVPPTDQFIEARVRECDRWLDEFIATHFLDCTVHKGGVVPGDPAEEILKYIDREEIDCVFIGTHGSKGLGSVLFGSVAKEIVGRAPVPVLSVNPFRMTKSFRKRNAQYLEKLTEESARRM